MGFDCCPQQLCGRTAPASLGQSCSSINVNLSIMGKPHLFRNRFQNWMRLFHLIFFPLLVKHLHLRFDQLRPMLFEALSLSALCSCQCESLIAKTTVLWEFICGEFDIWHFYAGTEFWSRCILLMAFQFSSLLIEFNKESQVEGLCSLMQRNRCKCFQTPPQTDSLIFWLCI